jgi:hypothetical protein
MRTSFKQYCPICGEEIDSKDTSELLNHGIWNSTKKVHECIRSYAGFFASKAGEKIQWIRDEEPMYLEW